MISHSPQIVLLPIFLDIFENTAIHIGTLKTLKPSRVQCLYKRTISANFIIKERLDFFSHLTFWKRCAVSLCYFFTLHFFHSFTHILDCSGWHERVESNNSPIPIPHRSTFIFQVTFLLRKSAVANLISVCSSYNVRCFSLVYSNQRSQRRNLWLFWRRD